MTYIDLIDDLSRWIASTSVVPSGTTFYVEVCLEDEIEQNPKTSFPCAFICPIPFDILDSQTLKYNFRIYVADRTTRSPNYVITGTTITNRINTYGNLITWLESFISALPDEYIEIYPFTVTPILLWDHDADGLYFDLSISSYVICNDLMTFKDFN